MSEIPNRFLMIVHLFTIGMKATSVIIFYTSLITILHFIGE